MNVYVNGEPRTVAPTAPLLEVLDVLGSVSSGPRRGVAVAVDGTVVPRSRLAEVTLHEGARVEVVTAVQGG